MRRLPIVVGRVGSLAALLLLPSATFAEAESSPNELLSAALRAEFQASSDSQALLAEAEQVAPEFAPLNWRQGKVSVGDAWRPFDEAASAASNRRAMTAYLARRDETAHDAASQLALADWCRKQRLPEQERAHLWQATLAEPNHAEARRRLGHVWTGEGWVDQRQIAATEQRAAIQQQAYEAWRGELTTIVKGLQSRGARRRDAAWEALAAIDDPLALPALHEVVAPLGPEAARFVLDFAQEAPGEEASLYLATVALTAPHDELRAEAVGRLATRPFEEYIPELLAMLSTPVEVRHQMFVNAQGQLVHRAYSQREDASRKYVNVQETTVHRVRGDLPYVEGAISRSGRQSFTPRELLLRAGARLGIAARDAEASAATFNQGSLLRNAAIVELLQSTTGETKGSDAKSWWSWWYNYLDVVPLQEKSVVAAATSRDAVMIDDLLTRDDYRLRIRDGISRGPDGRIYEDSYAEDRYSGDILVGYRYVRPHSCFVAGTPVWTDGGLIPIESIQPGDMVLAKDEISGELGYRPVLQTTVRQPTEVFAVEIGSEELSCTSGHMFWVSGRGWTMAKQLEEGAPIHAAAGVERVVSVESLGRKEPVYNLVVADWHSYFVGDSAVLTHDVTSKEPTLAVVPGLLQTRLDRGR